MSTDTSIDVEFEGAAVSIYPDVKEVVFTPDRGQARLTYAEMAELNGLIARVRDEGTEAA